MGQPCWRDTAGTVTAEFAVVVPAVLMLIALALGLAAVGMTALELHHGAQTMARALGRGSERSEALAAVGGAAVVHVNVTHTDHLVCVTLRRDEHMLSLLTVPVTARSCAPVQGL